MELNIVFVLILGVVFLVSLILLAIKFPNPTSFQFLIFRTTLSLSSAGIAAAIPGFLSVSTDLKGIAIRAGGALAVFLLVYRFNPARLLLIEKEINRKNSNSDGKEKNVLEENMATQTALLQINVSGSIPIITQCRDDAKETISRLRSFLSKRIKNLYSGCELFWSGDSGIYYFKNDTNPTESCRNAIFAAIEIQHSMSFFNTFINQADFEIKLRFSIDFQTLHNIESPDKILEPRYSWFLKNELEITQKKENCIAVTEDLLPNIGNLRSFCKRNHIIKEISPSLGKRSVQIFFFDTDKAIRTESLFSLLHYLKKQDSSLFQFLNHNINLVEKSLHSLAERNAWHDLLLLREYLYQFFEITGKYSLGISAGKIFLESAEKTDDTKSKAWILLKDLGWLEILRGNFERAENYIKSAMKFFDEINNYEGLTYAYRYKSVLHYMKGDYKSALISLKEAEKVGKKCSSPIWNALSARLLNNKGRIFFRQGKYEKALKIYKESLCKFDSLNDKEHKAIVELNIGETYLVLNNTAEAEKYLCKGLIWATNNYWIEGCGRAKFFFAQLFREKSELMASKIFTLEAQSIFRDIGAKEWEARVAELILRLE